MSDLFSCPNADLAGTAPVAARTILLVEDNPVNGRLAIAILELLGCAVIAADSGEKAIERLRLENGIDLIFMDCQMPDMDGFEATRIIRAMQRKGEIPHLPIIALTAFAMKGDRERCLEAGMDDYLTKPLHKEALERMLAKWLGKTNPVAVKDNCSAVPDDIVLVETPCLDRQTCDEIHALMGGRFEEAVQLYFKDTDDRIRVIEDTLAVHGDTKNIALQAHSIKSSSAHMGAARLAILAGTMETSAQDAADRRADAANLAPLLKEIRTIFAETQRSFQRLDGQWASG